MGWLVVIGACGTTPSTTTTTHWFDEVAQSGVELTQQPDPDANIAGLGAGVSATDLDGDGLPELAVAGSLAGLRIYHNLGGLHFEDVSDSIGIDKTIPAQAVGFADLDNDGDQDLIVVALQRTYIYENQGGHFVEVSQPQPMTNNREMRGIQVADFDNDGLLDLLVLSSPNSNGVYASVSGNLLYRNVGGLAFTDVTAQFDVGSGASLAAASVDYDLDGKLDLYIANDAFSANYGNNDIVAPTVYPMDILFHNIAPQVPSFENMIEAAQIAYPRSSMGIIVADFNGDGLPDFYVSDYGEKSLFINQGNGTFENQVTKYGIGATSSSDPSCKPSTMPGPFDCLLVSWGSTLSDVDMDGWDDLIVVNGSTFHFAQETSQFKGGENGFSPVDAGLPETEGRTLIPIDLDGDGDLDLVVGTFFGPVRIFENVTVTPQSNWLQVNLQGTTSNRDGVGAVVEAKLGSADRRRYVGVGGVVHAYTNAGAYFGLGSEHQVDLEVTWPDGTHQEVLGVESNQVVTITEN